MDHYLYTLVRYVPDQDRMEPINIGVILQGAGRIDLRLYPYVAMRKEIDTEVFRKWKRFLTEEIKGEHAPLFQPERTSPRFLIHLQQLCEGAVLLSGPLVIEVLPSRRFEDVLNDLYERLVAPPEATSPAAASRPTGRFRQITESQQFLKRGMKRHEHVLVDDKPLWMAYRQVVNGQVLAIDKIEVNNRIGATANEIERLPRILEDLPTFLGCGKRPARFVLLADYLEKAFSDQSEKDFQAMRDELEQVVEKVKLVGGRVFRTVPEAEQLGNEVDRMLHPLETDPVQE